MAVPGAITISPEMIRTMEILQESLRRINETTEKALAPYREFLKSKQKMFYMISEQASDFNFYLLVMILPHIGS